jgi:hypothetical protein
MRKLLMVALLLLWPSEANAVEVPTVYDNMHMFPVGSRAAGMAGAYTALGCDEAALQYNVASLACAGSSRLELSANIYMIQSLDVPGAFGEGQDLEAITYHAVPSIVGGTRILRDPDDDSGAGRVALGLSVAVPHSLALTAAPGDPQNPNFLTSRVRDTITTADLGVAWQIDRTIALGVSVGAGLRTYEGSFDFLATDSFTVACPGNPAECRSFLFIARDEESLAVGGRAKLGMRITPIDELALGLSVTSPSLDFYGTSSLVTVAALAIDDLAGSVDFAPFPERLTGSSDLSLPFRVAVGIAYIASPRFTLSFDASLNFPHEVRAAYDLTQTEIQGVPALTDSELLDTELIYERQWQPNFNIGAEFGITDKVAIDVGAFTDLSSVPSQVGADAEDAVHMFGGTVALGLLGDHARGWFGISFEAGQATSQVFDGALDLDAILDEGLFFEGTSTITRWTLAGFIGSNYSFFGDDDEDEDEDEEDAERPATPKQAPPR